MPDSVVIVDMQKDSLATLSRATFMKVCHAPLPEPFCGSIRTPNIRKTSNRRALLQLLACAGYFVARRAQNYQEISLIPRRFVTVSFFRVSKYETLRVVAVEL
ncbi:hypothetical protein TRVL_07310 [Trypanosoma vivax]|nr:hypothetical protein TRVL_07310 [Trypanosoma vivax]